MIMESLSFHENYIENYLIMKIENNVTVVGDVS